MEDATHEWPPVLVPTDRPRRPGAAVTCSGVVRTEPAGPPDVLLAGFAAVLHRYTGLDRVGLELGGARLRFRIGDGSTLPDLTAAGETVAGAGSGLVGARVATPAEPAGGEPLELRLVVRPDVVELWYDPRLFDRATVVRLLGHHRTLVEDGLAVPGRAVARLRMLTEAETRRILVGWNRTHADLPHGTCLHHAFESRVDSSPDATAVLHAGERWTYRRVNAEANRVAHHLRSLGVGPDVRVGLCLDRSPGMLVSVLGVLKAGGVYVPLDPDYPTKRLATMVEGTSCAVMISRTDLAANLPAAGAPLVLLDRDAAALAASPDHDPGPTAGPENLCYVIHTSGSTGVPKPIALRHRGVMNNLADLNSRFEIGQGDSVLALSSTSFDMSVYEFLGITIAGGTLVMPDLDRSRDPAHWAELLMAEQMSIWNSAPALLGLLLDYLDQAGIRSLPALRLAMLSGDWVPVTMPGQLRAVAPGMRIAVLGGAAEASIYTTLHEVGTVDPARPSLPYGRPMANQRTYILDAAGQPVPPGVPGELYLAGIGLARGYLDQPERTAERFVEWSHGELRDRLYRTGDLARFDADGMIELLGRLDFQVKINGLRVELGEIEAVLRTHPAVRQTAVVARDGRLVAYVVAEGTLDTDELRALAAERLPEYMVPRALLTLASLPLSPNGKLDRAALPAPDFGTDAGYRAPGSAAERVLAGVYAEVLGRPRIGVDDDFVALGGDSIRTIQVVTRARTRGLEITTRQVLECRTVAALARAADPLADNRDEDASAPLVAVTRDDLDAWKRRHSGLSDVWSLTPMQSGMLFESTLNDTGPDPYLVQTGFHLSGRVDPARLRAAGQALLDRHSALRVAFGTDAADNQVQLVVDHVELPWRELDLGRLTDDQRVHARRRTLARDRATRFDLTTPPLVRMTLLRLGEDRAELVLTAHHALIDGWSEQVLAKDLRRLYADPAAVAPVRGFRDFLAWLSRRDRERSARAWAEELAGLAGPTTVVPAALPHPEATGTGEVTSTLAPAEQRLLAGSCAELGVTVNTLVQGAWAVLLAALTGRADVVFGATVSGRPGELSDVESMVGMFINTIPVRAGCAPGRTAAELLKGLQERQTALLDHHHHGLTDLHRDGGLDTLFDTLVVFQSYPDRTEGAEAAGFEVTRVSSTGGVTYPLALFVERDRFVLQYHRDAFDQDTAEGLAVRFRSILRQLATDPGRRLAAVDLLLPGENSPGEQPIPTVEATLSALVARRAVANPAAVAVTTAGRSLTYWELDALADRLARRLAGEGAGAGAVVGIVLPRSVDLVVALLGTLRSGAAHVLVDPARGTPWRDHVLAAADVALTAVRLDGPDPGNAPPPPAPHDLACLRFPPPADLQPAALAVDHRALRDGVLRLAAAAGLEPGTRLLAASPHEDTVALEILAALSAGATVELVEDLGRGWTGDVVSSAAPLLDPGIIRAITVVCTGDPPPESFVRRVREALPGVRLVDAYGTGTPVGAPIAGMRAHVLSPALRPLPPGVPGELYVAGEVAREHAGHAAARFVADPFGPPGARLYRTGEHVRWTREGRLEHVGRGASLTVGGHRVWPGEVEAVLAEHPAVAWAAVTTGDRLVGHVVPLGTSVDTEELREFAARRLPNHLVPASFVLAEKLPLAADGSIDRAALDDTAAGGGPAEHRPGRTPQEVALCELVAEILGIERVGIDDNLFSLGVNSLMAGRLVSRMRRTLGMEVSIRTVFRSATIANLSGQVTIATTERKARPRLRRMTPE